MIISNLCAHVDPNRRVYYFKADCPICSPLSYRCIYCYQPARGRHWIKTQCVEGEHDAATDGFGALCAKPRCGVAVYEETKGKATECKLPSGHVLAVYPFRCEVCTGTVSVERPTICEESYSGQHLLSSGFIDMGLEKRKVQREDGAYTAEINTLLAQLRRGRLTRRFVSKARR